MKCLIISVDYHDLLAVSLAHNLHHFSRVLVVTAPGKPDIDVALKLGADVHVTPAFYQRPDLSLDYGLFRKWAAVEEGFDVLGRDGWLCLMDADVLWPKDLRIEDPDRMFGGLSWYCNGYHHLCSIGKLYGPLRRMWTDWPSTSSWKGDVRVDPDKRRAVAGGGTTWGVAVDHGGDVYVLATDSGQVTKFSPAEREIAAWN